MVLHFVLSPCCSSAACQPVPGVFQHPGGDLGLLQQQTPLLAHRQGQEMSFQAAVTAAAATAREVTERKTTLNFPWPWKLAPEQSLGGAETSPVLAEKGHSCCLPCLHPAQGLGLAMGCSCWGSQRAGIWRICLAPQS